MKETRILGPAVLALALAGGAANAQTTGGVTTGGVTTGQATANQNFSPVPVPPPATNFPGPGEIGFPTTNPFTGTPNNGFNTGFVDQFGNFTGPGVTFQPGLGGFGNPGWGYWGPPQTFTPQTSVNTVYRPGGIAGLYPLSVVPTAGLNAPPLQKYARSTVRTRRERINRVPTVPSGQPLREEFGASARYDEDVLYSAPVRTAATSPRQVTLAEHAERIMEERAMREGTVEEIGATRIRVSYLDRGATRSVSVPVNEVFVFRTDGRMETAGTAPGMIGMGQRVLFAEQRSEPRTLVAGSRQEVYQSQPEVRVRTRVQGARQSIRTRRPAK